MRASLFCLAALSVALTVRPAQAATFSVLCDYQAEKVSRGCNILLSGPLVSGDSGRLLSTLKRRLPEGWRYGALLLDSPGGSVEEAIKVADVVRRALLDTSTYRFGDLRRDQKTQHFTCVSACFLVWVAGAERNALPPFNFVPGDKSAIGLHRPYFEASAYHQAPDRVAAIQQQAMLAAEAYLRREQVPQHLIEKMLQRPSTQVYWLSEEDTDAVVGQSAWFQEMMIARCEWDPAFDQDEQAWSAQQTMAGKHQALQDSPRYKRFITWRQRYNSCQYGIRAAAQAALN